MSHWITRSVAACMAVIVAGAATVLSQSGATAPQLATVTRLDARLEQLVPADVKIEKLNGELRRAEGPLWVEAGGFLLLSDLNEIMKWTPGAPLSIFRAKTFGGATPAGVRVGTNGLAFDRVGRIVAAEHGRRRVIRIDQAGVVTLVADRFKGRRFNSPNDVVVARNGDVYFTDSPYLAQSAPDVTEFRRELDVAGVYRVNPSGAVDLIISDLAYPNGLALSPHGERLYVSNSRPDKKWMVYDVRPNGNVSPGAVLLDLSGDTSESVPDGMKVDALGNVYAAGPGGILVISPDGTLLGTIHMPEIVSNVGWGDPDRKGLYVTARTGLYRVRLKVPGNPQ